jgi:hypothetical protein
MEAFGKCCLFVLAVVVSTFVSSFTFSYLWLWFVVPIFGLPTLTLVQSAGIVASVSYVTAQKPANDTRDNSVVILEGFLHSVLKAGMYLFIGYILHLMM